MAERLHVLIGGPRHRERYVIPERSPVVQVPDPDPLTDHFTVSLYRLRILGGPRSERRVEYYAHDSVDPDVAAGLVWDYLLDRAHALTEVENWARTNGREVIEMLDAAMAARAT